MATAGESLDGGADAHDGYLDVFTHEAADGMHAAIIRATKPQA